jgi:hypothetical protein
MASSTTIPQIVISVAIDGISPSAPVSYSYTSPSGEGFTKSPTCILANIAPAYCLFALDYASSNSGWTITDLKPTNGTRQLAFSISDNNLALTTTDVDLFVHTFTITFLHTPSGTTLSDDPQEGNIPIPVKAA